MYSVVSVPLYLSVCLLDSTMSRAKTVKLNELGQTERAALWGMDLGILVRAKETVYHVRAGIPNGFTIWGLSSGLL